ncbi:hypothetical protein BG004_001599, partial [Podila humilis]
MMMMMMESMKGIVVVVVVKRTRAALLDYKGGTSREGGQRGMDALLLVVEEEDLDPLVAMMITSCHGDSQGYNGVCIGCGGGGIWAGGGADGSNAYGALQDGYDYGHFMPRSPEPEAYSGQDFSHDMMYAQGLPSGGVNSDGDGYYGTHYMNEQYPAEYYAQDHRAGQGFYPGAPHPRQPTAPNQVVERKAYIE